MNSVTGESGPVSLDRPRPAISHEVPGRVEQPGPVTPPVGLQGIFLKNIADGEKPF
jgi:hypothetical protein